jgi:leucyl-tRNA synthetase
MSIDTLSDRCSREKFKFAHILRRNPTPSEAALWRTIRNCQLGEQFWRQIVILGWIVDFLCPSKKLIIEIDGGSHDNYWSNKEDAYRDSIMEQHGFRVLRISEKDVLSRLPQTLELMQTALQEPILEESSNSAA